MFDKIKFDEEMETVRTQSVDTALDKLPKYTYKSLTGDGLSVKMSKENEIEINCGRESFGITKWGYLSFLRKIKLSPSSANDIPLDLLQDLINNILQRLPSSYSLLLIKRGDTIVNIGEAPYWPISNRDLISKLHDKEQGELNQIIFNDRGLSISLLDERLPIVEPQMGDIIRCGISLNNSESCGEALEVDSYFLRLVCTNGITVRDFGHSFKPKQEQIRQYWSNINYLMDEIKSLSLKHDITRNKLLNLINTISNDEQVMNAWNVLRKVFDTDRADTILRIGSEERKQITKAVKERRQKNRILPYSERLRPQLTKYNLYDMFNRITDAAKRVPYQDSLELQRFGGSMLYWNN